ncbi:kinase that interacts with cdc31p [Malassezia brasiliensis]|uniref:non-specific serine/threonine protein kinase n=1 Tax=Malassezia brasiliensis TaxID=1821822 RepID=A0AAF0DS68_9BASI|nr:kinase that interacts with cdc31p [Malassezia brasiliensis]
MPSESGTATLEPQWANAHLNPPHTPAPERRHAIGRVPVPHIEGAAAAPLPEHLASLPYLNDAGNAASAPSTSYTPVSAPSYVPRGPPPPHSAPIGTATEHDRRFGDTSSNTLRTCRRNDSESISYLPSSSSMDISASQMSTLSSTSRTAKPYAPDVPGHGAVYDHSYTPVSDLSRSRQPSSGSLARSFASEEETKHASSNKSLAAAANRVAGTFSRLTRLHKRQTPRAAPSSVLHSADADARSERDAEGSVLPLDANTALSHTDSGDTSMARAVSETSLYRHKRGTSERSQASSGGSLALRDAPQALGGDAPRAPSRAMPPSAPRSDLPMQDHQLQRLELIGRGAFGAVYRARHLRTNSLVALKVIDLDTPDDDVSEIQREVALLSQMRQAHTKNIVRYWGSWLQGPTLCILMDYAEGGSVRTLMKAGPIQERHLAVIMREMLVALDYIHKAGIIHRDIKAANILVTRTGQPMLCDFGVAASFVHGGTRGKRTTFIGTPYWMAPEVIAEGKAYDYKADIWSLGVTAYEIATGNPPNAEHDQQRVIAMIPKSKPPRLPDGPYSAGLREFVAGCLDEDPQARLSAEELSRTKWIRAYAKLPVSVLRELLAQYAAWTRAGGVRTSLIQGKDGPLALRFADEEPSVVPIEPEWKFESTDSDDGLPARTDDAPPAEPVQDHPLKRLFDAADAEPAPAPAPASSATKPAPSAASTPRLAPPASTPARVERPTGSGFTGSGATPFRFGIGSRAEPQTAPAPAPQSTPPAPSAEPPVEPSDGATPSVVSRSPSLAAIDEAEHAETHTSPSTSPFEANEPFAPNLSQPTSPEEDGGKSESDSPRSSPALRRVGRFVPSRRAVQPPALRMPASSSSLGLDATRAAADAERRTDPVARNDIPSFLEEPFAGFRPQGAISRTRSRSGSAADLRSRAYAHQSTHSLTSRTRIVPMQQLLRMPPDTDGTSPRKAGVGTTPSPTGLTASASLSVLGKSDENAHLRKHHGGSDPTTLLNPLMSPAHLRKTSDLPLPIDEGDAPHAPQRRHVPALPTLDKDVFHTPPATLFDGPALRPLDLANLMNRQELHTELMQTVNELGAWLDAVAAGLSNVLTPPPP